MNVGEFYFLKDSFSADMNDPRIMRNKPPDQYGRPRDRPYCIGYIEPNTGIFWMSPVSSEIIKFRGIYDNTIQKRGKCDTIRFYKINGNERAFLIQNMVPVTQAYIKNGYLNRAGEPIRLSDFSTTDFSNTTRKVLHLIENGSFRIFTDALRIKQQLLPSP